MFRHGVRLSKKYNWNYLYKIANYKLKNEKTGHDYDHILRVLNNACLIAKSIEKIDYDVLIASCILHDISLFYGPSKKHHITSADQAVPILEKAEFEKKKIAQIHHAILHHNKGFSSDKNLLKDRLSTEAKILCDADRMDAIGAIGLIRMIEFSNKQSIPYFISLNDKLDQTYYGNIKYMAKIGGKLYFPSSRKLSIERIQTMRIFLKEMKKEFQ